jgi:AcrR family transcriptional regulator
VRSATTRGEATRDALLAAALERFTAYGYGRTSVEDIARTAGVARATVYLHFEGKEEIFRALAEAIATQHRAAVERAATAPHPVRERIQLVLAAKFGDVAALAGSLHGAELLDENNRLCGEVSSRARRHTVGVLRRLIQEGSDDGELDPSRIGLRPQAAAELIFDTARSLERECPDLGRAAYRRRLRQLAQLIVAGLVAVDRPAVPAQQ